MGMGPIHRPVVATVSKGSIESADSIDSHGEPFKGLGQTSSASSLNSNYSNNSYKSKSKRRIGLSRRKSDNQNEEVYKVPATFFKK